MSVTIAVKSTTAPPRQKRGSKVSVPKVFSYACDDGHTHDYMAKTPRKWRVCPVCKKRAMRTYAGISVTPDALPSPLAMSTLLPTRDLKPGEKPTGWDTAESRTDIKRTMDRHNRKYGTTLQQV